METRRAIVLLLASLALLAACASDDPTIVQPVNDSSGPSAPSSTPPLVASPIPPASPTPTDTPTGRPPLDPDSTLVQDAVGDLADRLGINRSEVTIAEASSVTWGDSSLGCPEPGMQYLQRIVDGSLVVLEAEGRRYEYHGGSPLTLCEHPKPPGGFGSD